MPNNDAFNAGAARDFTQSAARERETEGSLQRMRGVIRLYNNFCGWARIIDEPSVPAGFAYPDFKYQTLRITHVTEQLAGEFTGPLYPASTIIRSATEHRFARYSDFAELRNTRQEHHVFEINGVIVEPGDVELPTEGESGLVVIEIDTPAGALEAFDGTHYGVSFDDAIVTDTSIRQHISGWREFAGEPLNWFNETLTISLGNPTTYGAVADSLRATLAALALWPEAKFSQPLRFIGSVLDPTPGAINDSILPDAFSPANILQQTFYSQGNGAIAEPTLYPSLLIEGGIPDSVDLYLYGSGGSLQVKRGGWLWLYPPEIWQTSEIGVPQFVSVRDHIETDQIGRKAVVFRQLVFPVTMHRMEAVKVLGPHLRGTFVQSGHLLPACGHTLTPDLLPFSELSCSRGPAVPDGSHYYQVNPPAGTPAACGKTEMSAIYRQLIYPLAGAGGAAGELGFATPSC